MSMSARWTFTLNNPPLNVDDLPGAGVAYSVYQKEIGELGTPHFQGYIRFQSRKRMNTVINFFNAIMGWDGVHVEIAKGNEAQNKEYCTKEPRLEGPWEYGEFKPDEGKQGKRSDLDEIADNIKTGKTLRDIAESHPSDYIRYHGGIQAIHMQLAPKPALQRNLTIVCLWGPTGTGKTHRFLTTYPDIYSVKPGRDPWGQYHGEKAILFDEFDPTLWRITDMNRYLDKWRCLLDARYTDRYAEWELVGICANSPPQSWFSDAPPMLQEAFRRRIRNRCWEVNSQQQTLEEIAQTPPTPL